ncbi:hypothetical protein [Modicisalibacter luteus]|uniref:Uncharacterized protein n=1 Tax=Modicisalibacter luteus TaxID=453962 RepID=A0ABV7M1J5_9GAMM|nr:hypothetical protein [Halomonas lutea]GHB12571.1 hypothetical protein GCM10007159_38410 [Halomonas lutea]
MKFCVCVILGMALVALGGCVGNVQLSASMATINSEYGEFQNEALLLNILRRSASMPAHFTSLVTLRESKNTQAGANLSVPFGYAAPAQFGFNPNVSMDQGPSFEVALKDNQEFYRGYITPISTSTIQYYLQQDISNELLLSLFTKRLVIRTQGHKIDAFNSPEQPKQHAAFQQALQRLLGQGLTMEEVSVAEAVGPTLRLDQEPSLDQALSAHKEGLSLQPTADKKYQLSKLSNMARFCFTTPREPLTESAYCTGPGYQFAVTDPLFFGSTGKARAVLDPPGELGSIEIHTRSLAEIMTYLGNLVRIQQASQRALTVPTATGPQPILVVKPALQLESPAVVTEFEGTFYGIPSGTSAGQSGTVLTILSQLFALAQSVKNLPVTNTVTILGE